MYVMHLYAQLSTACSFAHIHAVQAESTQNDDSLEWNNGTSCVVCRCVSFVSVSKQHICSSHERCLWAIDVIVKHMERDFLEMLPVDAVFILNDEKNK